MKPTWIKPNFPLRKPKTRKQHLILHDRNITYPSNFNLIWIENHPKEVKKLDTRLPFLSDDWIRLQVAKFLLIRKKADERNITPPAPIGFLPKNPFLIFTYLNNLLFPIRACLVALLIFLTSPLFSFSEITYYAPVIELKTITGTLVDKLSRPLNSKVVLLRDSSSVTSDSVRNGQFKLKFDPTSVDEIINFPTGYSLGQNYPNPFNPSTVIEFSLPEYAKVDIAVFDVLGRKVRTLVNEEILPGRFKVSWNGQNDKNEAVSAGVYIYQIISKDFRQAKKMVLVDGGSNTSGEVLLYRAGDFQLKKQLGDEYKLEFSGQNISTKSFDFELTADSMHFEVVANRLPKLKQNIPNYTLHELNSNGWNDTLILNLNQFFDNDDANLYSTFNPQLIVQDSIMKWVPSHNSASLNNVVIRATDVEDPSRPAWSNGFNITFIPVKHISSGFIYDIDTKYGNRTAVPNGAFVAYLGSEPSLKYDIVDGHFFFRTNKSGNDSIFVVGKNPSDTAFYFWKNNRINLDGDLVAMAFKDTTGIPMMRRGWDTSSALLPNAPGTDARDYMTFLQDISNITKKLLGDSLYKQTTPRFKGDNMNIKVYLNRSKAPVSWYPDSSFSGIKKLESERFHVVEHGDSASADIVMTYTNLNVGNTSLRYDMPPNPALRQAIIKIRGPPNGGLLPAITVPYVVAHEAMHAVFTSGEHSKFLNDMLFIDVGHRFDIGFRNFMTPKETWAADKIFKLERNPKLLDYFR